MTVLGRAVDPDELRLLAARLDAGERGAIGAVAALPAYVLTERTLGSDLPVIADRLRLVAGFAERWARGEAFRYPLSRSAGAAQPASPGG